MLALRAEINKSREDAQRISVNDFVIRAAALALRQVPKANAIWTKDAILLLDEIDISVAVATDGGLITPIVRRADEKSLGTISREVKDLAARARAGKLKPEEYQGGGFSISNLGMYGVREFSAIINPPQSCILAVGAALRKPAVQGRGDRRGDCDGLHAFGRPSLRGRRAGRRAVGRVQDRDRGADVAAGVTGNAGA